MLVCICCCTDSADIWKEEEKDLSRYWLSWVTLLVCEGDIAKLPYASIICCNLDSPFDQFAAAKMAFLYCACVILLCHKSPDDQSFFIIHHRHRGFLWHAPDVCQLQFI